MIVPRKGPTERFRFRDAFSKRKFGDGSPLAAMEAQLEAALAKHNTTTPTPEP